MKGPASSSLIGASAAITALNDEIARVAKSDVRVLITGESGAGKEVVARAIFAASRRNQAPFVAVNCAGLPETLLESELFGHVKGSFTGAYRDKAGKLETANGGTLLLDEIGEMSPRMQALLLRFLETGEVQKVGAERVTAVDVRVIAATNRDLCDQVSRGRFREDLFYRLNIIHLTVPPLREHPEDIPLLVSYFLDMSSSATDDTPDQDRRNAQGVHVRAVAPDALAVLQRYPWPGNVRELQNVLERLLVMGIHDVVQPEDLPPELCRPPHWRAAPVRERRQSTADRLFKQLVEERESFWTTVYPLYMNHEITKETLKDLVDRGLREARGHYKVVLRMFNMHPGDYKRFLNFLTTHDCRPPYRDYRH